MTKNITNRQLFFILSIILTAFSVINIAKNMAERAGRGYWIPVLTMTIVFSIVVAIIVKLNNMHKNKMICDYSKELVGPFFTIVISLYYFSYMVMISIFLINQLAIVLKANYLKTSPIWATMLVGVPVYCYVAYKGINTLARMVEIVGILFFGVGTIVLVVMLSQGKVQRILPLFNPSDVDKYIKAIRYAIFPFLGAEILLFFPFNKKNGKKSIRVAVLCVVTVGLFYLLIITASIMKVGLNSLVHYKDSIIVTVRDMEVPMLDFLKRLDILYLTIGFMGLFMSISLMFTVVTEILLKLLPKLKRLYVVIFIGIFSYGLGMYISTIISDYAKFITGPGLILGLIAEIFIPSTLLIISIIKKKKHGY